MSDVPSFFTKPAWFWTHLHSRPCRKACAYLLRQNIETANSALTSRHHVHESCASITKTFYEPLCHCSKAELAFQNLISDISCNAKDAKDAKAYFMARLKSSTLCPVHGTHVVRKSPNECPVGLWILLQTRNMLDFDCLHLENFLQHNVISVLSKLPSLNSYSPGSVALKRVTFIWGPAYGAQISFDAHQQSPWDTNQNQRHT